jgi:Tol biopolymer transport system component
MNVWVLNVTVGTSSLLFEAPGWDTHPAWSPDGNKIALVSDWIAYDFVYDIYMINSNGSGFTALTGNIYDQFDYLNPSWSPGSVQLAVTISPPIGNNPGNSSVGIMNPNGGAPTIIMTGAAPFTRTSWSADGTRIAYTSISGSRLDVSWVSVDGSSWGTIVANGWDADWQH